MDFGAAGLCLIKNTQTHYENFLFHKIYQDLNVFFTTDLSSLYLDILKDRLYTFKKEGLERRSAQSAIYLLLKNLFTFNESHYHFSERRGLINISREKKRKASLLTDFPSVPKEWIQPKIQEYFKHWLKLREKIYSEMEPMRKQKQIGSSLETRVVLSISKDYLAQFKHTIEDSLDDLKELFIVSQIELQSAEWKEWKVEVKKAKGEKCERCWNYSEKLNSQKICPKCVNNLS